MFILSSIVAILFYFLPWAVAKYRKHLSSGKIFWLNLLLGWSGIAWVVALVWAGIGEAAHEVEAVVAPAPVAPPAAPVASEQKSA